MKVFYEYLEALGVIWVVVDDTAQDITFQIAKNDKASTMIIKSGSSDMSVLLPCELDSSQTSGHFERLESSCFQVRLRAFRNLPGSKVNTFVDENSFRWSRQDLESLEPIEFRCKKCLDNIILGSHNLKIIRDLPSDNWAELMDYWHCHRPETAGLKDEKSYWQKYGQLRPNYGEVLIGEAVLAVADETLKSTAIVENGQGYFNCAQCNELIGENHKDNLQRLYKWRLTLCEPKNGLKQYFPAYLDIVYRMLSAKRFSSVRYFELHLDQLQKLYVWLFADDITVGLPGAEAQKAIKVLYQEIDDGFENHRLHNVDIIDCPSEPFDDFMNLLKKNNEVLPRYLRCMDQWKVAYIPV